MDLFDCGGLPDHLLSEIPKALYEKILIFCKSNSDKKLDAKDLFITSLDKYIQQLIQGGKYEETFTCFQEALTLFPEDAEILNTLAVSLNRLQKPLEAIKYFDKALNILPDKLKILENSENVINEWIPRWHFTMLNDKNRNSAYRNAISKKIKEGYGTVLDIGTGSGLLSLYAHNAGASKIFACETNDIMLDIAEKVFQENEVDVKLIHHHSTNLNKYHLDGQGADLIVTEIFDSGAFGEGVLTTLIHAKEKLLNEKGRILPESITIYVIGVNNINVKEQQDILESTFENSIYLKNSRFAQKIDGPYETLNQNTTDLKIITDSVTAFTVDFNNVASMNDALDGNLDHQIKLIATDYGVLEGFLVYFELHLDIENILTNFDLNDARNRETNCWDPIIFPLNCPISIRKYQDFNVKISCKKGILNLSHDYDSKKIQDVTVEPEIFAFLTDDEYIHDLEYNVGVMIKKQRTEKLMKVVDFMPFPHIGINLLKENKITELYCLCNIRELIETVADWNCIPKSSIIYIYDIETLFSDVAKIEKFDLILLQPITNFGTLNEDQLRYYEKLKANCLNPNGIIFPYKIDLCCKLIHSTWLDRVTTVRNEELANFGIENLINKYSTKHQFEYIDNIDSSDLSEVFTMSTIQFNEKLYKKNVVVNLNQSQPKLNGILYFYKIYFANNSMPLLTNRIKSFCKCNCFVQPIDVDKKSSVIVSFMQNDNVFRCFIKQDS